MSIKKNEFRYNNLLYSEKQIVIFRGLYNNEIIVKSKMRELQHLPNDKDLKPIPLTEKWLLDFGFTFKTEELGAKLYEKQNGISFLVFSDKGHFSIVSGKTVMYIDRDFVSPKFVHQLQNLYFALTGIELAVS
jgi:hypothetical protein